MEILKESKNCVSQCSKANKRIGETNVSGSGETMKIVQYVNNRNMTVQFEDGTEKEGVGYGDFKKGLVRKPGDLSGRESKARERLGEICTNTSGERMEIVKYDSADNMTVRFEDGTEREGVAYHNSKNGYVRKPVALPRERSKTRDLLGEVCTNTAGKRMGIVKYITAGSITVRFEDGTERSGIQYNNFKKGYVTKPGDLPRKRSKNKRTS